MFLIILFAWLLFSPGRPVPTLGVASSQAVCVLHGPLRPKSLGFAQLWETSVKDLKREHPLLARLLGWLGRPQEMTFALMDAGNPDQSAVLAVRFPRCRGLLQLLFWLLGTPYRGARYLAEDHVTFGMYSSALIVATTPTMFCFAVDNLHQPNPPIKIPRKDEERADFLMLLKPKLLKSNGGLLPAEVAEGKLYLLGNGAAKMEWFLVCQDEREARLLLRALDQLEVKALSRRLPSERLSFRRKHQGQFVWWEIHLSSLNSLQWRQWWNRLFQ